MTGIAHLNTLVGTIRKSDFEYTKWFDVGLSLNVLFHELKAIEKKYSDDIHRCLTECLSIWIKEDGANVLVLAEALEINGEKRAAEKILSLVTGKLLFGF